ncbi:MAG: endopeptidase La [Muribaculaceae bacterium]|nr:endopeptidase La [Muribaculaceae bacterium]
MNDIINDNLFDSSECKVSIGPIITEIRDVDDFEQYQPDFNSIPLLPLREVVLFPGVTTPIAVGREATLALVNQAYRNKQTICTVTQRDSSVEHPTQDDLFEVGATATILKVLEMPDGTTNVILQVKELIHLDEVVQSEPYLRARVSKIEEVIPVDSDKEMAAVIIAMKEVFGRMLASFGEQETQEIKFAIKNIENPLFLINFICVNSPLDTNIKQALLEETNLKERAMLLTHHLDTACQLMEIKANIQSRTREDITQQQREHFLHQQMRAIQDELGGSVEEQEIDELRARGEQMEWPEYAQKHFDKELRKLERYNPQSPDYSIQFTYIETLLGLPWDKTTKSKVSIPKVEKTLNRDHYGLENVKERIIEHMAVLQLRGDMKAPIICLYGPPGVGKTSLGRSIADAIGREYARISLGGLHDESEIRGHRKTYIGAMPGRIISAMSKVNSSNPVIVLDEIDKIGKDFKGDPSTALLEVLDPEQNCKFHDNYIDVDYDLSKAMFIATANDLSTISRPLLDRMEIIEISSYISEEKIEIARRHLVPKLLEEHGFEKKEIEFHKSALTKIVDYYTRESGVRRLEKKIAKVLRKIARLKASGKEYPTLIKADNLKELLGPEEVNPDMYENNDYAGVVTGLAWTQVGGDILFIESSISKGKGDKLTLTGNLGDVMKESAMIAIQYLKANGFQFGINSELFEKYDIHIHVPEGAIPKDGPSAGVTMVTSIASLLTQRKVRSKIAMTGEITLRGKVLPVGGIKEKILAAKRAGITDILLCALNRKDIEEIDEKYLKGLTFHYVNTIREVLDFALLDEKVDNPLTL